MIDAIMMKMDKKNMLFFKILPLFITLAISNGALAHSIVELVKQIKPSVVGVGIYEPLGRPKNSLHGTGFVIADGSYIATNFHVVEKSLNESRKQSRVIFIGSGENPKFINAVIVASDPAHDIAILKMNVALTPVEISGDSYLDEGTDVAFTGFPIGAVLGLYPATHRGMIAAVTPVVRPSLNANQLSIEMLKRLREPYFVYQLDATAYPGNSGSPVYGLKSGKVLAIINKVFVKQTKESVLSDPSGITYAIPIKYLRELATTINISL